MRDDRPANLLDTNMESSTRPPHLDVGGGTVNLRDSYPTRSGSIAISSDRWTDWPTGGDTLRGTQKSGSTIMWDSLKDHCLRYRLTWVWIASFTAGAIFLAVR